MSLPCINPNPDISGVGVRISVYAQAVLTTARLFIFLLDGRITASEHAAMGDILLSGELTALSLLVSRFIQAKTYGLSVYHANILLALSWITVMPLIATPYKFIHNLKCATALADGLPASRWSKAKKARKPIFDSICLVIHYGAAVGLGIWIWKDVESFGSQPECTPQMFLVIFGSDVFLKNHKLKILVLSLYAVLACFATLAAYVIPDMLHRQLRKTHSRLGLGRGAPPRPRSSADVDREFNPRNDALEILTVCFHAFMFFVSAVAYVTPNMLQRRPRSAPPRPGSSSDVGGEFNRRNDGPECLNLGDGRGEPAQFSNRSPPESPEPVSSLPDENSEVQRSLVHHSTPPRTGPSPEAHTDPMTDPTNPLHRDGIRCFALAALSWVIVLEIAFIACTEILVRRSRGLVLPGESRWTFGQTLALSLVIIPLVNFARDLRKSLGRGAGAINLTPRSNSVSQSLYVELEGSAIVV